MILKSHWTFNIMAESHPGTGGGAPKLKPLKIQNAKKDLCLAYLEVLEQYTRMNNVIVTGLCTKPHSYTKAVTTGREQDEQDDSYVEQQVATFLKSKGIELESDNRGMPPSAPEKQH